MEKMIFHQKRVVKPKPSWKARFGTICPFETYVKMAELGYFNHPITPKDILNLWHEMLYDL
jgi:hypothetical protein